MRTYRCVCKNVVFFDNTKCLGCGQELGFCPECHNLVTLLPQTGGGFRCGNSDCGAALAKCFNYRQHHVCNRCVPAVGSTAAGLCDCCRFSETIPDLNVPENWEKWRRLEAAKRRLFYDLSELGLPYGMANDGMDPPLRFDFKADPIPADEVWRDAGSSQKVFTGHERGRITINIREADDAEREKLRVSMKESQRTLIGHFRHEIGHYYWEQLVKGRREDQSKAVFGDHDHPSYNESLAIYYQNGPLPNWQARFISAYATMHPWEDFAETWASYLDMVSALDTAEYVGFGGQTDPIHAELDAMLARHQELGIALNEISRSMGLLDVVPEVFTRAVVEKLRFIHELVLAGRAENKALQQVNPAPVQV